MKRISIIIIVVAAVLFGAYMVYAKMAQPQLSVPETIDVGEVRIADEVVSFPLTIRNTGGGELAVMEIQPDCDCTTVEDFGNVILLNTLQSKTLNVTINISRFLPDSLDKKLRVRTVNGETRFVNIKGIMK